MSLDENAKKQNRLIAKECKERDFIEIASERFVKRSYI